MLPPSEPLSRLMRHALKRHRDLVDRLIAPYDVYPGQPPLLMQLSREDGQSQRELAGKMRVAPATLNVMIGRMEKAGHLRRESDDRDQRVSRVFLTDKGRAAAQAVQEALQTVETRAFRGFLPEELLLLRRFVLHMQANLDDENSLANE
ncbi:MULTISPECIES: MarR family winged helix-turn-helix transcriptional regulator [Cohnella]|uniref:MarR family winged helix-turn-helix transcriptional regulator n=1 Tax=Cohnella TaxID=329857 RepID=UPI0009BB30C8|nr:MULTISPECIES: MarR family transcriptional regulator [Cohnella]MBN2980807.1 MarR family transcriptional regulator [Cohnella algarum]